MRDPWGDSCGVVPVEYIVLVGWDVVESDSVRLNSSFAHVPDLVASYLIVEVLVVSGIRHVECIVQVIPWLFDHVTERIVSKGSCELLPAINLVLESGVECRPIFFNSSF